LREHISQIPGDHHERNSQKAADVFIVGLRNQHAVESQAIELLERQVGRLESSPEMSERMRCHIRESQEQARRIEERLIQLGTSRSATKDLRLSFVGNLAALGHATAPDEVIKNTFANYAFEHYSPNRTSNLRRCRGDDFFRTFEDRKLAFLHQDKTADSRTSRFCKFIRRDAA
jgi:ferritin-like metal-binding protein YciE